LLHHNRREGYNWKRPQESTWIPTVSSDDPAQKVCSSCGADVTHHQRHKTGPGEYLCADCHRSARESSTAAPEHKRKRCCVCCGDEVVQGQYHRNRFGEYVCLACRDKGLRTGRDGAMGRRFESLQRELKSVRQEVQELGLRVSYLLVAAAVGIVLVIFRWIAH
jgi:hypothetical protein